MTSSDDWFDDSSDGASDSSGGLEENFLNEFDSSEENNSDDEFLDDDNPRKKKKVFVAYEDPNRVWQFEGNVIVTKRDEKGLPVGLALDIGQIKYPIVMDKMGQQLIKLVYNRLFIGAQIKVDGEEKFLVVKNFV